MNHANFREVFSETTSGPMVLRELVLVGWTRLSKARVPGLHAHAHVDAFEIFLIERGRIEWWVEDEVHRVSANHVLIHRPGERHGSMGHGMRPCGYLWPASGVAVSRPRPRFGPRSARFGRRTARRRARSRRLVLRARLHLLLAQLLADQGAAEASVSAGRPRPAGPSFAIAQALRAIQRRPAELHTVADLAKIAKLSATRFSERFLAETGSTPARYLRQERIERAKRLLRAGGRTVAETAQATGFSSGQNFATTFRQFEGMSPGDYARQELERAMVRLRVANARRAGP